MWLRMPLTERVWDISLKSHLQAEHTWVSMASAVQQDTSKARCQNVFLDGTVMEVTTCQLGTFWECGSRSLSAKGTRDRAPNCDAVDVPVAWLRRDGHRQTWHILIQDRATLISNHVMPHLKSFLTNFLVLGKPDLLVYLDVAIFLQDSNFPFYPLWAFHFVLINTKQNLVSAFWKSFRELWFPSELLILHSRLGEHCTNQHRALAQQYSTLPRGFACQALM